MLQDIVPKRNLVESKLEFSVKKGALRMIEWKLKSRDGYSAIYEQKESEDCYNTAYFDLASKLLHVTYTEFVRNNEPRFVPQDDVTYHSAKYGHWVTNPAYL